MNVRLAPEGKVHTKRFSWHTACGRDIDEDSNQVSDTSDVVTCAKCLSEHKYLYVGEIAGFGVLIDRDERHTELVNSLHEKWYPNDDRACDMIPYLYTVKIYAPFQLDKEMFVMSARLPDDEVALNLAEILVWWRIGVMNDKLFAWPNQGESEPVTEAQP